jgi:hypothetical protein
MKVEVTNYRGWPNTLRVSNGTTELHITTDVGPRILSYQTENRGNIFKIFEDQCGQTNEEEWMIRGGHRFWLAPEDWILSYHVDNRPVQWKQNGSGGELIIESLQNDPTSIRKTLGIRLSPESSAVTIRHTATNEGSSPFRLATWGLSVMRPGGLELIPQPALGEHPRDILPNRGMVLWPYTDLADPRYTFGTSYWLLRQEEGAPPTKIGLKHDQRWIGYLSDDLLFIKKFDLLPNEDYPDGGCNFETFTNGEMIEIESLGPLKMLEPGESVTHTERWQLFPLDEQLMIDSEPALAKWLTPYVKKIA